MVTIISGTNRKGSMTLKVAKVYHRVMSEKKQDANLVTLEDLNVWERNPQLISLEKQVLIPSSKFVFVMPEYNGSFPGILKLFLDTTDIRACWWHKKAMLVGVADGRGGNLRGLEHMTNILHYLKMNVLYNKLPLSRINDELDEAGELLKPATILAINQQIEEFMKY